MAPWQPHGSPWQPMGLVIPGIFGPDLALLGSYPWPAWRAASKFEHPRWPLGGSEVENKPPLLPPRLAQQDNCAPGQLPSAYWAQDIDALAAIFDLCGSVALCPVALRPCGGGNLTGSLQGAPAQKRWLCACRTAHK